MTTVRRDMRTLAAIPLSVYLVAVGISLWFFNPITQQNQFAALFSSELFTVAMMFYVYLHEDFDRLAALWFGAWWFAICVMLSLAFL